MSSILYKYCSDARSVLPLSDPECIEVWAVWPDSCARNAVKQKDDINAYKMASYNRQDHGCFKRVGYAVATQLLRFFPVVTRGIVTKISTEIIWIWNCWHDTLNCKQDCSFNFNPARIYSCKTQSFISVTLFYDCNVKSLVPVNAWEGLVGKH